MNSDTERKSPKSQSQMTCTPANGKT